MEFLGYFLEFINTILNFKIGFVSIQDILITVIIFTIIFEFINIFFGRSSDE